MTLNLRDIPTWTTPAVRGTYEVTPFEFGDTCPLLQVSKKHEVDYGDLLLIAHRHAFKEELPGYDEACSRVFAKVSLSFFSQDIDSCIWRMEKLYNRTEYAL